MYFITHMTPAQLAPSIAQGFGHPRRYLPQGGTRFGMQALAGVLLAGLCAMAPALAAGPAIAAGDLHTCALSTSGTVQCWGSGGFGQLGNGSTDRSALPVAVKGVSTAVAVASGYSHSCAVLQSGAVQCWGGNANGQLGNGATANSAVPVTVSGISTAIAIAAGYRHS